MVRADEVVIGAQHGDDCTCRKLEPFEVSFTPVVVSRSCSGQTELPDGFDEIHGRVIITWPKPRAGVGETWGIQVTDVDTGEPILDGTSISIAHGTPTNWSGGHLILEMTRILHADGEPLGTRTASTVDGKLPYGWFRYVIAEMRVGEPAPAETGPQIGGRVWPIADSGFALLGPHTVIGVHKAPGASWTWLWLVADDDPQCHSPRSYSADHWTTVEPSADDLAEREKRLERLVAERQAQISDRQPPRSWNYPIG